MHQLLSKTTSPSSQLDCACKFIVISLLSVCFIVGLVLGFSMCFLEAFLHLLNIGRDSPVVRIRTYCGEEKINRESRSSPKHEVLGGIPRNH